jgi:hypothetical protein
VVEQRPFKPKVVGSIPTAPTNQFVFQAVAEALSNKTPISNNCLSSLVLLSDFEPRCAAHLKALCVVLVPCPAVAAQSQRRALCVAPNSLEPRTRVSPGQSYNPATLTLKIDKRPPIPWPHKESVKIDDLDISERHFIV